MTTTTTTMPSPTTRRYVLELGWGRVILAILLFGGAFLFFAHRVMTNDRGLIINGILEFGTRNATIVYGLLAACSAAFVLAGFLGILRLSGGKLEILVTEESITLPGAIWRRSSTNIPWRDITDVRLETISGQEMLRIESRAGKAAIVKSHLTERDWNELRDLVLARVPTRHH